MKDSAHTNEGEPQRKPKKHNWGTKAILEALGKLYGADQMVSELSGY